MRLVGSQAIKMYADDQTIYASGAIPLDPKSMEVVSGGIEEQTVSLLSPAS